MHPVQGRGFAAGASRSPSPQHGSEPCDPAGRPSAAPPPACLPTCLVLARRALRLRIQHCVTVSSHVRRSLVFRTSDPHVTCGRPAPAVQCHTSPADPPPLLPRPPKKRSISRPCPWQPAQPSAPSPPPPRPPAPATPPRPPGALLFDLLLLLLLHLCQLLLEVLLGLCKGAGVGVGVPRGIARHTHPKPQVIPVSASAADLPSPSHIWHQQCSRGRSLFVHLFADSNKEQPAKRPLASAADDDDPSSAVMASWPALVAAAAAAAAAGAGAGAATHTQLHPPANASLPHNPAAPRRTPAQSTPSRLMSPW